MMLKKYSSKNAPSHNVDGSVKEVLDRDPDMDDFLNVIISSLDQSLPVCEVW